MRSLAVFHTHGRISRALAEIEADGGPDLDLDRLAAEAQVSVDLLCQMEGGRLGPVHLAELERLCQVLGRSPNDLLGYEPDF
jgi:DNA-binding Xre family transcriptional regulator